MYPTHQRLYSLTPLILFVPWKQLVVLFICSGSVRQSLDSGTRLSLTYPRCVTSRGLWCLLNSLWITWQNWALLDLDIPALLVGLTAAKELSATCSKLCYSLSFHVWLLTYLDIVYLELSTARVHRVFKSVIKADSLSVNFKGLLQWSPCDFKFFISMFYALCHNICIKWVPNTHFPTIAKSTGFTIFNTGVLLLFN